MDNLTTSIPVLENQYSLPLYLTVISSWLIYRVIVRRFLPDSVNHFPDDPNVQPLILSGEETYNLLGEIGLEFLTYSGPFIYLMLLYLCHIQNLMDIVDLNLSTLDIDVLRFILGRLRFLIINHELIFNVIANYCRMNEQLDLPIDFDTDEFHTFVRDVGNRLFELYRNIERELNIDDSDLPDHWTEF